MYQVPYTTEENVKSRMDKVLKLLKIKSCSAVNQDTLIELNIGSDFEKLYGFI